MYIFISLISILIKSFLFVFQSFSNQICRTSKRWQRRWFVLYDDGELTYSVDDHPETVPQVANTIYGSFLSVYVESIHSITLAIPPPSPTRLYLDI